MSGRYRGPVPEKKSTTAECLGPNLRKLTHSFWDFRGTVPKKGRHTHLGELLGPNLNKLTLILRSSRGPVPKKKKRKTARSLILGLGLGLTLLDDDVGAMEPRQVPGLRAGPHGDAPALRALRRRPETGEGLAMTFRGRVATNRFWANRSSRYERLE